MLTFAAVASYPPRRRGDTPRSGRRRTSGRVIGVSGGRRRRFNHHHLVRLSCGAETTLGRYLNHSIISHKKEDVFYSRLKYKRLVWKERKKEKNENERKVRGKN